MKTAISVPDDIFAQAEQRAREMGISRSQFYSQAAKRYLDDTNTESITARIDAAIASTGADDSADLATAAGRRRLDATDDDW